MSENQIKTPHFKTSFLVLGRFHFLVLFLFLQSFSSMGQTPHIDSLLIFLRTAKDDTVKANTLIEVTRAFLFELNDYTSLNEYNKQQIRLSEQLNFKKGIAYGASFNGICYWRKGNYEMALYHYKKALKLMKESGLARGESSCNLKIGMIN
jgi:tetratricopeptide (TPR) repeat protein